MKFPRRHVASMPGCATSLQNRLQELIGSTIGGALLWPDRDDFSLRSRRLK